VRDDLEMRAIWSARAAGICSPVSRISIVWQYGIWRGKRTVEPPIGKRLHRASRG
jgi:hypothetical protein